MNPKLTNLKSRIKTSTINDQIYNTYDCGMPVATCPQILPRIAGPE